MTGLVGGLMSADKHTPLIYGCLESVLVYARIDDAGGLSTKERIESKRSTLRVAGWLRSYRHDPFCSSPFIGRSARSNGELPTKGPHVGQRAREEVFEAPSFYIQHFLPQPGLQEFHPFLEHLRRSNQHAFQPCAFCL